MSGDGGQVTPITSISRSSSVVSHEKLELIKQGRVYYVQKVFDIAIDETLDLSIDSRLVIPDSHNGFVGNVIIYPFKAKISEGLIKATLYGGGSYSGGTVLPMMKRNEKSENTNLSIVRINPDEDTIGIAGNDYLLGSSASNQFPGGGESKEADPLIIDNNIQRVLRIPNTTGVAIQLEFRILIAEF